MCVACVEFIKETLTLKEYQSALFEVTRGNESKMEEHLREIERVLRQNPNDTGKVRAKIKELTRA